MEFYWKTFKLKIEIKIPAKRMRDDDIKRRIVETKRNRKIKMKSSSLCVCFCFFIRWTNFVQPKTKKPIKFIQINDDGLTMKIVRFFRCCNINFFKITKKRTLFVACVQCFCFVFIETYVHASSIERERVWTCKTGCDFAFSHNCDQSDEVYHFYVSPFNAPSGNIDCVHNLTHMVSLVQFRT